MSLLHSRLASDLSCFQAVEGFSATYKSSACLETSVFMNPPLHPDASLRTADPDVAAGNSYAPSVPISVYRELATELKTTQAMVDALTRQNQQLTRQNKLLRHEIHRFVQSAEQLAQFAGVTPVEAGAVPETRVSASAAPVLEVEADADTTAAMPAPSPPTAALVRQEREPKTNREPKRPRPEAPPNRPKLFTEQRDEFRRSHTPAPRSQDLGNLWLVTTILLVVFTAFGAGFLIMRPLLSR
jgi:hypothetical protein